MSIKEVEDKIIEQLTTAKTAIIVDGTQSEVAAFAGFDIDSFPAKFDEFKFTSSTGCLLVQYLNTNYAKNKSIDMVNQNKDLKFNLFVGLRYLSKHNEAYPFLEKVENFLTGLKVDKYTPVLLQSGQYLDEIEGDLWYGFTFSLTGLNVENTDQRNLSELEKLYPAQVEITKIKQMMTQGGLR